jgi:hypothetical protein
MTTVRIQTLEQVPIPAWPPCRSTDWSTRSPVRPIFVRQFLSGGQSRYIGTALRVGRLSGVAASEAVGADAKVAIIARLTAYRC